MQFPKRHLGMLLVFVASLLATGASQSQTMTSMVESVNTLPAARALAPEQVRLHKLLKQMDKRLQQNNKDYEAQLVRGVLNFQLGKTNKAVAELTHLTKQAPSFRLAYLLLGDMLSSKVMPVKDIGNPGLFDAQKREHQLKGLRMEMSRRMEANLDDETEHGEVPLQFLKLSPLSKTALLVDKSQNRLYLFERSAAGEPPHLVHDYYVSTGKRQGNKETAGDLRTPEGVYYLTREIPDNELPAQYGVVAFPTNYPNAFDRHLGKTGEGIWLHGTDKIFYSRPPMDSEGCVSMTNIDLNSIRHLIVPGLTPIVITHSVQWVNRKTWERTRKQLLGVINQWRRDWQSMNVNKYLSHYASNFWGGGYDFKSWEAYKRRVAAQKTYQKIKLKDLSLFYYPRAATDGKKIVVARFQQDYQSNNFKGDTEKHLYLELEHGQWKIIYEGK